MIRTIIFAHYDKDCLIDNYVLFYLEELKKCCDNLIFVSDTNLSSKQLDKISEIADDMLAIRHCEYDFGSYKRGLEIFYKKYYDQTDELVLCNDSCYGGLFPFSEIFASKDKEEPAFWGLTESVINKPHLKHIQSFFIVFRKDVFSQDYFKKFFESVKKEKNKFEIVSKYEIALTQEILKHTTNYSTVYNEKILKNYLREHKKEITKELKNLIGYKSLFWTFDKVTDDIMHSDFIYLLIKLRCPVLKTSLGGHIGLAPIFIEKIISNYSEYDFNLIKEHQNRIGAHKKSFIRRLIVKSLMPSFNLFSKVVCAFIPSKPLRQNVRAVIENALL